MVSARRRARQRGNHKGRYHSQSAARGRASILPALALLWGLQVLLEPSGICLLGHFICGDREGFEHKCGPNGTKDGEGARNPDLHLEGRKGSRGETLGVPLTVSDCIPVHLSRR